MKKRFLYCEDGENKACKMNKVYRMYCTSVDNDQKRNGTDFSSWLQEMEHMQILTVIK